MTKNWNQRGPALSVTLPQSVLTKVAFPVVHNIQQLLLPKFSFLYFVVLSIFSSWCCCICLIKFFSANPPVDSYRSAFATACPSQQNRGDILERGRELLDDISEEFSDNRKVTELAVRLLNDVDEGGFWFVQKEMDINSDPVVIAKKVLEKWIKKKPTEATTANLIAVLTNIHIDPAAVHRRRKALKGWL